MATLDLEPRKVNFARQFKAARKRDGLSQPAAAIRWNVPVRALRNWEQGIRIPSGQTIVRLLPVLFPEIVRGRQLLAPKSRLKAADTSMPQPRQEKR
jgi:transcriptional regulator with XRE-family HTH domain